jgi:hypothetical protein
MPEQLEIFETAAPASSEPLVGQFTDGNAAKAFMLAGNAHVTLKSIATGTRFTYRIRPPKKEAGDTSPPDIWFVQLLTGQDNNSSYKYIGQLTEARGFWHGRKSAITEDAKSVKAFDWCWQAIRQGRLPVGVECWHEDRCGRCGRRLTVPASIGSGFGPECLNHIHGG